MIQMLCMRRVLFLSILLSVPIGSWAQDVLMPIDLQLRWVHQFQFAGYYMAKEKGYYAQAGLDVTIHGGGPNIVPAFEVLEGRAQFGVGNMEVLSLRLQGKPFVALAALYQHSPSILLVRQDSDIYTVRDLRGKKVMLFPGHDDPELLAMFRTQGIRANEIQRIDSSTNINDLINKNVDAFNAYLSNEPFFLQEQGIGYRIINPRDYGVDFYSDILFTTQAQINQNPKMVEAFRKASLQGWTYALDHPQETIQILLAVYNVKKSKPHLEYESQSVREMVLPELVELGYMSRERWQQMAKLLEDLNIINPPYSLEGFLYAQRSPFDWQRWIAWIVASVILLVIFASLSICLLVINRRLKHEVIERKKAEELALHLSLHDNLTGLPNRALLMDRLEQVCKRLHREQGNPALLFIDLDGFKGVNDCCGHEAGDKLLCDVANRLVACLREMDTVVRFGGDEFVILLENNISQNEVRLIAEKIQKVLVLPAYCPHQQVLVTASIGLVRFSEYDTPESVLRKADSAMYHVKTQGKNGTADFHDLPQNQEVFSGKEDFVI